MSAKAQLIRHVMWFITADKHTDMLLHMSKCKQYLDMIEKEAVKNHKKDPTWFCDRCWCDYRGIEPKLSQYPIQGIPVHCNCCEDHLEECRKDRTPFNIHTLERP